MCSSSLASERLSQPDKAVLLLDENCSDKVHQGFKGQLNSFSKCLMVFVSVSTL